jgi:hypothetical protein
MRVETNTTHDAEPDAAKENKATGVAGVVDPTALQNEDALEISTNRTDVRSTDPNPGATGTATMATLAVVAGIICMAALAYGHRTTRKRGLGASHLADGASKEAGGGEGNLLEHDRTFWELKVGPTFPLSFGDAVWVHGTEQCAGVVKYVGPHRSNLKGHVVLVELERALGNTDGSGYFNVDPDHGVLVPIENVSHTQAAQAQKAIAHAARANSPHAHRTGRLPLDPLLRLDDAFDSLRDSSASAREEYFGMSDL